MKNLLFLLFCFLCFNSNAQYFDTGLEYRHKLQVGKGVTLSGLALMNYTEGPTETIGAVWAVGGAMNFISAKQEDNYYKYEPTKIQWRKEIVPITAMFLAGAMNGVNQDLLFHYHEFESTFPNANPQFGEINK